MAPTRVLPSRNAGNAARDRIHNIYSAPAQTSRGAAGRVAAQPPRSAPRPSAGAAPQRARGKKKKKKKAGAARRRPTASQSPAADNASSVEGQRGSQSEVRARQPPPPQLPPISAEGNAASVEHEAILTEHGWETCAEALALANQQRDRVIARVESLIAENKYAYEDVETCRRERAEMAERLAIAEADLETADNENKIKHGQVKFYRNAKEKLEEQVEELQSEVDDLHGQPGVATAERTAFEDERAELEDQIAELEQELADAQAEAETAQIELFDERSQRDRLAAMTDALMEIISEDARATDNLERLAEMANLQGERIDFGLATRGTSNAAGMDDADAGDLGGIEIIE